MSIDSIAYLRSCGQIYEVDSHAGLADVFTNRVRKEWNALGLFEKKHCTNEGDYEGKVLALKPSVLKHEYSALEECALGCSDGINMDIEPDEINASDTVTFVWQIK